MFKRVNNIIGLAFLGHLPVSSRDVYFNSLHHPQSLLLSLSAASHPRRPSYPHIYPNRSFIVVVVVYIMEIGIKHIPHEAGYWDIVRAIAGVLHSDEFRPQGSRKENFKLSLSESNVNDVRNGGTGSLTVPTEVLGFKLLRYVDENPIRVKDPATGNNKKIRFFRDADRTRKPSKVLIETLSKTPFVEPDNEEAHQKKLAELADQFRVDSVQFGVFYRESYPTHDRQLLLPRSFSIEFKQDLINDDVGWLKFEYSHKLIRITVRLKLCRSLQYRS